MGMTGGVAAHITRGEADSEKLSATLNAMGLAGMRWVRTDFDSTGLLRSDGSYDFSKYDRVVKAVLDRGKNVLPILYGPNWTHPPVSDEDFNRYSEYIKCVVGHFKDRIKVWEIWNEANLSYFFDGADPVHYAKVISVAYKTIKSVDPRMTVIFTGTSGLPFDWIEKTFAAGATNSFDIMNVHPYSHPYAPENGLCGGLDRLRRLMHRYGIGDKPVWITELGWPTHDVAVFPEDVFLAGLKVARPGKTVWKIAVADVASYGAVDQRLAVRIQNLLTPGSVVRAYSQNELAKVLRVGRFDAVIYPFDETYPIDTTNVVRTFVREGGTLVDFGGVPCYYGRRDDKLVKGYTNGEGIVGFSFGYRAFWSEGGRKYPREAETYVTVIGEQAGIKERKSGFRAVRFLSGDRMEKGDELIPLVAGKTKAGVELVSAAVIRYRGSRKGSTILSSLVPRGVNATNDEMVQASYTARAMIVSAMQGIEAYFAYNLRASEDDPYYSEAHFGLMHSGFQPKPAFSAYMNFFRERPNGSVSHSGRWKFSDETLFSPQWKRPDGIQAGALWTTGRPVRRAVRFRSGTPRFRDVFGKPVEVRQSADGAYTLNISGAPMYFSHAELQHDVFL